MAFDAPPRLLHRTKGKFQVVNTGEFIFDAKFDIISYTWGDLVPPYRCGLPGVSWRLRIPPKKIEDIKKLMIHDNIEYLWVDCICLNQEDDREKSKEIPSMYKYYKSARKCYVLMDLDEAWNPQDIVNNLKFIDHILSNMEGTTLTPESDLTENMIKRLSEWETMHWTFPVDWSIVRAAAVDMGVLNCYSTCISRVKSIFTNAYFTRVWVR
jgi:hypothetical protein